MAGGPKPEQPDSPPKQLYIGAINPFALCEAVVGRKLDWNDPATSRMLSSILQTDYEELFDMRFRSILYAGIRLNDHGDKAEPIPAKEMHTLTERDLVTPDFSKVEKLSDLRGMGLKDFESIRVKHCLMSNGNLRLTLEPHEMGKKLRSSEMTAMLRDLCTPFRTHKEEWTPPNGSWVNISNSSYRHDPTMFSNPVQGAASNSWLMAALMSVAWSDPSVIKHCDQGTLSGHESDMSKGCTVSIKLYSKGGDKDASTATVTVNGELPVNNSSSLLMYGRPNAVKYTREANMRVMSGDIWPALYEKAFAKWITGHKEQHPDLTQTSHGDPVKALAQLTDKNPQYYFTANRRDADLLGLVRTHSFNLRTIYPMVAWTHPSGDRFLGSTLVSNMAYSVLGWATPMERKQYLILRHPWGVVEPQGITSYPGLVTAVDAKFWPPIELVDSTAVFAIETSAFKEHFAGLGLAK